MHSLDSLRSGVSFSLVRLLSGLALLAALVYVALIAIVVSYAALTIAFTQSVRNDEAQVAQLESHYLSAVASITSANYAQVGYQKPLAQIFVPSAPATALR